MRHTTTRPARAGFTLIELLVVLAIIAILTSLTAAAVQRIRILRLVKSSEDTVSKLQSALDNQVKITADNVKRERIQGSNDFKSLATYCGNDEDRAEALLLYCRLRQALPQTAAEVNAASFTVGGVVFPRLPAFNDMTGMPTAAASADQVSAALLYAALSRRSVGGNMFVSDDATAGAQMDIALGGTRRVYKDGWDNPVGFRRFHQSAELDAAPYSQPADATKDPNDPLGRLAGWPDAAKKSASQSALGTTFGNRNTVPTAFSFGLNKASDNLSGDDILGYKLRSLGAKGFNP